ncbi:unnamed protein product, partial [Mesorhabditis belari]|uniref:Uncharacterized protein n=1 Tax=Mesorhabditis belari TaxID=2138241 RepID=A0AAF3F0X6_9BILA
MWQFSTSLCIFLLILRNSNCFDYDSSSSEEDDDHWQCGTDFLTKTMSEGQIETDCPTLKEPINNCCISHDLCYDQQLGKKHCDDVFCKCLMEASRPSTICYKEDAPLFCALVVKFGDEAYVASGNKTGNATESAKPKATITFSPRPVIHEILVPKAQQQAHRIRPKIAPASSQAKHSFSGVSADRILLVNRPLDLSGNPN